MSFAAQMCPRDGQARLALPEIGRSGNQFQHCFRLFGVEKSEEGDALMIGSWFIRHTGIYHAMDIEANRSVWIVIKGNNLLRKRIKLATQDYLERHPNAWKTTQGGFLSNLNTHLLIFQWCTEQWGKYMDCLDTEMRAHTALTQHMPLEDMMDDIALGNRERKRRQSGFPPPSRHPTGATASSTKATRATCIDTGDNDIDPLKLFNFKSLQGLHHLMDTFRDSMAALRANQQIVEEFRIHLNRLLRSSSFADFGDVKEFKDGIDDVQISLKAIQGDIKSYCHRMATLLNGHRQNISLVRSSPSSHFS